MISRTRQGTVVSTYDGQEGLLRFLYGTGSGRLLLKLLVRPFVSRGAGWLLSTRLSRRAIAPFVEKNHLDLSDYPETSYASFNDFFTRKILPERRPIHQTPTDLIAPCDGKLTVIPVTKTAEFQIKGTSYTMASLLRDETLAAQYQGGTLLLFRLSVDDYHRYCYPADGVRGEEIRIPGVFHTVSPHGAAAVAVYKENTRTYTLLQTEAFGHILMMEVGALLVGRIKNLPAPSAVRRGQEKGMFEFGGSTIVLIFQPGRVQMDEDIVRNSAAEEETIVKMGEKIGTV